MKITDFVKKHNLDGRNWTAEEIAMFNDFLYTTRLDEYAEATDKCFMVVAPQTWTHDGRDYRIATPVEFMLRPDLSNTLSCHSSVNSNGSARGGQLGYVSNPYWVTVYASQAGTTKLATIGNTSSKALSTYIGNLPNPLSTWNLLFTEDDNDNLCIYVSRAYGDASAGTVAKFVHALMAKYPQAIIVMRELEAQNVRGSNHFRMNSKPTIYSIPVENQLVKKSKKGQLFYRYHDITAPVSSDPIIESLVAEQLAPIGQKVKAPAFSCPLDTMVVKGTIQHSNPITPRRRKVECPVCKKLGEVGTYQVTTFKPGESLGPGKVKMNFGNESVTCCDACLSKDMVTIGDFYFRKDSIPTEKVYKINEQYVDFKARKIVTHVNLVKQDDDSYAIGKVYHYPLDVPKEDGMDFASEDFILMTTTFHTIADENGVLYNNDGSDAFVHPQYRIVASGKWICDNFPGSYKGHFDVKTDDGRWAAVDCQIESPARWFIDLLQHIAHNPTNTMEEFIEVAERYKAQGNEPNVPVAVKKPKRNKLKKEAERELALV